MPIGVYLHTSTAWRLFMSFMKQSAAKKVLLALLPQEHVLGVQVDVATLARLCLHQGWAHASAHKHLPTEATMIYNGCMGAQAGLLRTTCHLLRPSAKR